MGTAVPEASQVQCVQCCRPSLRRVEDLVAQEVVNVEGRWGTGVAWSQVGAEAGGGEDSIAVFDERIVVFESAQGAEEADSIGGAVRVYVNTSLTLHASLLIPFVRASGTNDILSAVPRDHVQSVSELRLSGESDDTASA